MKTLTLALSNVQALRRRLLGLVILIAVALALCVASFAISQRAEDVSNSQLQEGVANRSIDLQHLGRGGVRPLTTSTLAEVRGLSGVADVEPVAQASFGFKSQTVPGVLLYATTPRSAFLPPIVATTRPDTFPLAPGEALLPATADGSDLHALLGQTIDVQVTQRKGSGEGSGTTEHLHVVGLFDPRWQIDGPDAAYVSPITVVEWAALREGMTGAQFLSTIGYSSATVVASTSTQVGGLLGQLQAKHFAATSLQQELQALPGVLELVKVVGYALLVFLLILTTFASYQVTSSLTRQRTREVGILKAVGFTDRRVFTMIASEAALTALAAAVCGLLLSVIVATAGNALLRHQTAVRGYLRPGLVYAHTLEAIIALAAVIIVVSLGALLPATKAARLTPAEAIREW